MPSDPAPPTNPDPHTPRDACPEVSPHASPDATDLLRAYLHRFDTPCPSCGYNLRGLTGDLCPECAQRLRLSIGLVEPKIAAFITGVIGLSSGAGFAAFVLVWGLVHSLSRGGGPSLRELLPLMVQVVVEGVLLWRWLAGRGPLRRMAAGARWALALATWVVSGMLASWFFATI